MEHVDIYYCNLYYNKLLESQENDEAKLILSRLHRNADISRLFPLKQSIIRKYWNNINSTELATTHKITAMNFSRLWNKYSNVKTNPFSKLNDPKQKLIKRLVADHTEMTIGDIIKVNRTREMYIYTVNGWKLIKFVG